MAPRFPSGLRSLAFHANVGIRKALRCCQPDARRPSRRSSSRFPSLTPTMQTVQDSRKGPDTQKASGVCFMHAVVDSRCCGDVSHRVCCGTRDIGVPTAPEPVAVTVPYPRRVSGSARGVAFNALHFVASQCLRGLSLGLRLAFRCHGESVTQETGESCPRL